MKTLTKYRIIGAVVILAVILILLSAFFEKSVNVEIQQALIPPKPAMPKVPAYAGENGQKDPLPSLVEISDKKVTTEDISQKSQSAFVPKSQAKVSESKVQPKTTEQKNNAAVLATSPRTKAPKVSSNQAKNQQTNLAPIAWTLQLASFSQYSNAQNLVAKLQKQQFRAYMKSFKQSDNNNLYRVYLGPLVQKQKLIQLQQRLANETGMRGVIIRYRP